MGKLKKNKETNVTSEEIKEDKIMTEETDAETSVIQEQIKPWHKRKFKKVLSVVGFSLLAGIIFGIAARFVFKYSDGVISKIFGLNQPYDTPNSMPMTISPVQDQDKNANNPGVYIKTPDKTEGSGADITPTSSPRQYDGTALSDYRQAMDEMHTKAENVLKGVVNIEGITSVVNWLGETVDQSEKTLGIIVGENPNNLYILTYYDKVKTADRIELSFRSRNSYTVSLLNYDESFNMAVLTLPKQALRQEDISSIALLEMGNSDSIFSGMPVIAVGSFDGEHEVIEYGMITNDNSVEYITDASIGIFTTNVEHSETGEGVMADLEGKVIGIITRKIGADIMPNVNKCMRVNDLIQMAEKLCNGENRVYFGIKAGNIPMWVLRENNLENGISVNNVEPSSPASDAGLRKGDFIISVNGVKINEVKEFSDILMKTEEGSSLEIEVYRESKTQEPYFSVVVNPVKRNN